MATLPAWFADDSEPLRLEYASNTSKYVSFAVSSGGSLTITPVGLSTTIASALTISGAFSGATTGTFSSTVSATAFTVSGSAGFADGRLYKSGSNGTSIAGVAGSSHDFTVITPTAGQAVAANPTGTRDMKFFADVLVPSPTVPSSASDTGTSGTISWDSSYVYVCTATDTWKRAALSTW